jgi:sporulation protein YlmC with PRC-barrel domain
MMRLSDLRNAKVRTLAGDALGRVHEVHCEGGRIVALTCGPGSFLESLTAKKHGRRIPWEYVRKVGHKQVTVTPDPPQRKSSGKKPSGPRTRRRTPRASGPRSKR